MEKYISEVVADHFNLLLSHSGSWAAPYPTHKGRGGSRQETEKKKARPPASDLGIQSLYGTCEESKG